MNKSGMSRRFWYLASMVILGALALGADLVWNSFLQYSSNDADLHNLSRFHTALLVMGRISAERGPANSAMTVEAGTASAVDALKAARAGVDAAIATLASQLADGSAVTAATRSHLAALRERLDRGRTRVDALIALSKSDRSAVELQRAIEAMFAAVDTAETLVDDLGGRTTDSDAALARTVIVSTLVTELRDIAGRLGSQYIVPLQQQEPANADRLAEIIRLRARIEQMHAIVTANIGTLLDDPEVAEAWNKVNIRYFDHAFRLLDGLKIGRPDTLPYPLTPAEFTARLVPDMATLQELRDLIIKVTFARASSAKDHARRSMMISGAATGLLILTMICIIVSIQRFLFMPLLYIRDQLMALALGTPGEIPMTAARSDEIREVFTALRLLRESQRARLAVERERDELNLRLKTLAETDPLTGVLNRRALDHAVKSQSPLLTGFDGAMGLILLDLDHFKSVNDVHGHIAGDLVLQETGRRIRNCVRSVDLVARFGGEEFAVVVAQPTMQTMEIIAEKIRAAMADTPLSVDGSLQLNVTASLGVALGRGGEDGWKMMLSQADQALYRAKAEGRNRVVVASTVRKSRFAA